MSVFFHAGPRSPRQHLKKTLTFAAVMPIGAIVALTGCSSDSEPNNGTGTGPCATSSTADREGVRPIPIAPATVTVLDPGTGEKSALTPIPNVDQAQQVTVSTDSVEASIAPGADGRQQIQKTQANLSTPLTARATCDDPTNLEFVIDTPSSSDEALVAELGAIAKSPGGATFAPGLNIRSFRLFPNEESGSPARSALEQSFAGAFSQSVPLPTEPVGVGARWQSVRTIAAAATIHRTSTVTLTKREGNILTLRVEIDETPADDVFRIPGSAQTLTLSRYAMSGSGDLTIDLTKLLPTRGKITTKGARELVGDADAAPLLQQNEYTVSWS